MSSASREPTKVCMFGASPGTGNLGVSALWQMQVGGQREKTAESRSVGGENT